ncbi:FimB/Mfa2 family fimbrial subunit [Bacteroides sp. GD17]|jgi:hypothetical protein|uniref:FimB/Mfa2 family fimbrial subunit n=1 Tax=Bacteroides sp. GD17 TaxID=3139826 RepID=UPI00313EEA74
MMKNSYKIVLLALLSLAATACIKDGFDSDNCPGEFVITVDYPDGTEPGTNVNTVITYPDGTQKPVEIGKDNPLDLDEGSYTVTSTTGTTGNAIVEGSKVTVETNPDGTAKDPDDFFGGSTEITVGPNADDGDKSYKIPVIQQTRPLIIKVKFVGNNVSLVEAVSGTVDGIALSRDLSNGFPPADGKPRHSVYQSGSIAYSFSKTGTGQEFLSETHRLLGIDGDAEQHLKLSILFSGQASKEYDFNIARAMDEFHITEVTKPWTIEITIYLGADFSATIEDWKAGPDIWMDAQH